MFSTCLHADVTEAEDQSSVVIECLAPDVMRVLCMSASDSNICSICIILQL